MMMLRLKNKSFLFSDLKPQYDEMFIYIYIYIFFFLLCASPQYSPWPLLEDDVL